MLMQSDLLTLSSLNVPMPPQAWIVRWLWLIPALPIIASGIISLLKQPQRKLSAGLAIGSLSFSFLLSFSAFAHTMGERALLLDFGFNPMAHGVVNITWFQVGATRSEERREETAKQPR